MPNFPLGYQLWSDYQDEAPDDLANRLRAALIDVLDRIANTLDTIADTIKENQ